MASAKTKGSRLTQLARIAIALCVSVIAAAIVATPASAEFGIQPGTFQVDAVQSDLVTPEEQAGARPYAHVTKVKFNLLDDAAPELGPDENMRDFVVDLPPGMIGNPTVLATCSQADFMEAVGDVPGAACPSASQVGLVDIWSISFPGVEYRTYPIYNLEPVPGSAATFGIPVITVAVQLQAKVTSSGGYRIEVGGRNLSQGIAISQQDLTFWGAPGSPAFDSQRFCGGIHWMVGCSVGGDRTPFMTNPTSCEGPLTNDVTTRSWGVPDLIVTDTYTTNALTGCESVPFNPSIDVKPTRAVADTPTGLDVKITTPQNQDPDGLATAHLKDVEVAFPEGMTINPSAGDGLGECTINEIGLQGTNPLRFDNAEVGCPNSSKIGQLRIDTPLLDNDLSGSIYQAKPNDPTKPGAENPFDSTLALYLAVEDPETGTLIKLAGEIAADQETGQFTATFPDNPQIPFESFEFSLKDGPRAPLVNPSTCGTKQVVADFGAWSGAEETVTDSFQITSSADGSPCPENLADRKFEPKLAAGLKSASADSYSPFSFKLTRPDGNQEIDSLAMSMPEGVTSKLAGVDYCPDATLNSISQEEGTAEGENDNPSCPANSQVGVATIGAGAGSSPIYVQTGKAYLAGPYKGSPLSLAVAVPALAGPFDLGTTVVRNKIDVDPRTAQITLTSDPLPQILHGIPLKLKDIRVNVNREGFMKAPTDCSEKQINATIQASHGKSAALTNRFQVGDCASLGFAPNLDLSFGNAKKNTKANSHPQLDAKLHFNEGDANISSVEVALPQGVFLDQERLGRICSRANYAAESCPAESQVGYAKAITPLLDNPVEGPVYLKASDNPLPDLAADLNGQIDVDLFGKIDQKQNKKGLNQIRNTFDVVPDVPVSDFELTLEGGDEGLLVNSRNICKSKKAQKVSIDMVAHNEMTSSSKPLIGSACKSINKKKASKLKAKAKKLLKKAKKADDKTKAKKLRKQARKLKKQARKLGR